MSERVKIALFVASAAAVPWLAALLVELARWATTGQPFRWPFMAG